LSSTTTFNSAAIVFLPVSTGLPAIGLSLPGAMRLVLISSADLS
jgi:hypothetical protein